MEVQCNMELYWTREVSSLVRQLHLHERERLACEIREAGRCYMQVDALYCEHYKQLQMFLLAC